MEGTIKMKGKSLITVLDEFNFISFIVILPQVKSFAPPFRAEQLPIFPPFFLLTPLFFRMSQFPGWNQQNGKHS